MKILITGATGGLGRNACEIAQKQGHQIIAIGRNSQILNELKAQGMDIYAHDLANEPLPASLFIGVDAVWHCAALSSPWGAYEDFYRINVQATEQLMQQAGQMGVPFVVHISTPSLYFDYQHHIDIKEDYRPSNYVNHYAYTKALAEDCVQKAVQQYPKTQYTLLRPRAIFGKYDQVLIPRLLKVIHEKGFLPLPNGGRAVMDFSFADNVVQAMLLATCENLPSGEAFNVSNHQPMALQEVLNSLFINELRLDFKIKSVPYPLLYRTAQTLEWLSKWTKKEPILTPYSVGALNFDMILNADKAKTVLGYVPKVTMEEAIKQTAIWFKSQHY